MSHNVHILNLQFPIRKLCRHDKDMPRATVEIELISPLDKMAAILADDIFKCIFLNENVRIPGQISLNSIVLRSPSDNKPSLVQVMAWRQHRRQAITWTNDNPVHRRTYAALGGGELNQAYRDFVLFPLSGRQADSTDC